MSYSYKPTARFPVMVRVYTSAGEITEHCTYSLRAAQVWLTRRVAEKYFEGYLVRVEYEFH